MQYRVCALLRLVSTQIACVARLITHIGVFNVKDYKRRAVVTLLNENGFYSVSTGEHEIFANANNMRIAVPQHKVISPGSMRNILRCIKSSKLTTTFTDKAV